MNDIFGYSVRSQPQQRNDLPSKMSALQRIVPLLATLLYLTSNVRSDARNESYYVKVEKTIYNQRVILDAKPIKNNTLLYATCSFGSSHEDASCNVTYEKFNATGIAENKTCPLKIASEGEHRSIDETFQLVHLDEDHLIVSWTDRAEKDDTYVKYETIRMSDCLESTLRTVTFSSIETNAPPKVYFVVYDSTFDVFYKNRTLCGNFICGQTHDFSGKLINGPVPSYFPNRILAQQGDFRELIYPLKVGTSAMGHLVISDRIYKVSSILGRVTTLTELNHQRFSYVFAPPTSSHNFTGFCALAERKDSLHCSLFDVVNNQAHIRIIPTYKDLHGLSAMTILDDRNVLLLARVCSKYDCKDGEEDDVLQSLLLINSKEVQSTMSEEDRSKQCRKLTNKVDFGMTENRLCISYVCDEDQAEERRYKLDLYSTCKLYN